MCGIAGYVHRESSVDRVIERMTSRLTHRGPDGEGIWRDRAAGWDIALGHRRLSIIDIVGGRQPLANERETLWITHNGEIYNFVALRATLEQRGHHFSTHSDTEVIVHQHEEHGIQGLADLRGMFAFAVWDKQTQTLLLARDRAGIKPLYYASLPDGGLAFASELTALMAHPKVDRALDPGAVASYFFRDYAHAPRTFLRGARKLEPGHYLLWTRDGLQPPKPFWQLAHSRKQERMPPRPVLVRHLRHKLNRAVHASMVSDVPLGILLSGGIDSSIVAAIAQRRSSRRLKTFSIAFEDPRFDESRYARMVAKHLGSEHTEETLGEDLLLQTLDDALDSLDEPIADASVLPTYLLSKLAARHVKVVLSGDGGDELWAGYPTYKAHRIAVAYRRLPRVVRDQLIGRLIASLPVRHAYQSFEWKAKRFAHRWEEDDVILRHMRWMSNTDLPDLRRCLTQQVDAVQFFDGAAVFDGTKDMLNRILALDFSSYLVGSVLSKVDRSSMAHGLEVRPPLLDNDLIDFAFSLPSEIKMRAGRTKALLKSAAHSLLPPHIITRRKQGFAIPLAKWLNGPLRQRIERVVNNSALWNTGLFVPEVFAEWSREHKAKRADYSRPLWALLVLDHWHNRITRNLDDAGRTPTGS